MQHPFHLMPNMMVGPWRIKARLGAGGFGAVFRVECGGEEYALKFAVHGPDSDDLNRTDARARRELACLLLITHPNVVRVWAHGRWPHPRSGYHYVVMDYVEGHTLTEWVKKTRPPLRQVLRLFDTLALALHALHAQDIHHRDLKGSNILVRAEDAAPVLVDFGAGEHAGAASPLTEGPLPPGTPHLRTPEALRFHREQYADPLARYPFRPTDDLYALGATLYEVLTGTPPFPPHLPREVLTSLIETTLPAPPDAINAQVPPALAALVLRLLAKRPEERPASGQALHDQLQPLLRDDTPTLDMSLSPGASTVTTEGMGGPAVMISADDPERPLLGVADWGGARASPGSVSPPSEASAPTVLTERASPGSPSQGRGPWVAVAALALLMALGASLWRGGAFTAQSTDTPRQPPASARESPPSSPTPEPAPTAMLADAGPTPLARSSADAGPSAPANVSTDARPLALSEPRPASPHQEGPEMRKPRVKSPDAPRAPEKPRPSGAGTARKLVGMATVCTLATGCAASEPTVRRGPPPPQQCPPGAVEAMKKLGILEPTHNNIWLPGYSPNPPARLMVDSRKTRIPVREGRQEVVLSLHIWHKIPNGTVLVGDFIFGDKLYARFVEARTPNGERYPFCAFLRDWETNEVGIPFLPESKPGAMLVQLPRGNVAASFDEH
ncbi:MAG: protein kinase [Myxococcaceae bacterium]|nr:protein kinase [Myxococcaceae bacterium]